MAIQRIERKEYLDKLIAFRDKKIIKVVTGVRRCGKSTIMEIYQDYLREQGVTGEQIIAINLEDYDFYELRDPKKLHTYVKERLKENIMTYVFLDEIQHCEDFAGVIDSLHIKKNVDLYITGSNAYMLSSEIATLIAGRYVEIKMLPLSFKEYVGSTGNNSELARKYTSYIENSSFPYALELSGQPRELKDYLDGIYNTILVKDVARREGITDIPLLESIVKCVASSIGSPISIKKISDTLNSSGRSISVNTVDNYLRALTDSYIFYKADRYDIKGRQHLKTLGKYYMVDTGLRNLLLAGSASDTGHLIENIVYLELLRRGNKVNIGKLAEKEVDFVARYSEGMAYYQVSSTVLDENTLKRELEPLQRIPDNHPKFLLTLDEIGAGANHDGIRQLNLIDWLLGK